MPREQLDAADLTMTMPETRRSLSDRSRSRTAFTDESLVPAQRLLGDVSHELRSPLARLCVALGLLRRCPPEGKTEYLDRIELEAKRLNKLIGQLLTLARIGDGAD